MEFILATVALIALFGIVVTPPRVALALVLCLAAGSAVIGKHCELVGQPVHMLTAGR